MAGEFIPRTIPRVKVALFGPSNVGKTLFRNVLLKKDTADPEPTEKSQSEEVLMEYKRPTEFGKAISIERYKLTLIDVPGKPNMRQERIDALSKVVGWIFMYDSTDPSSADMLLKMIKEELEPEKKLKSAIAMMVVGTKKDIGPNAEAIKKGEEIAKHLSKHTMMFYGYKVPHILISCKNQNEVSLTFLCLESINFDLKPPESILKKLKEGVTIPPAQVPISKTEKEIEIPPKIEVAKTEIAKEPPIETPEIPQVPKTEVSEEEPIEIPEVPEVPPPQEKPIVEPLTGLENVGKSIEEMPEIPSPTEILEEVSAPSAKIEREIPRAEQKIEPVVEKHEVVVPSIPKAEKAPLEERISMRFEFEKNENVLKIVERIENIAKVTQCYVLKRTDNLYRVAHIGEGISDDQKQYIEKVLSCCKIIDEVNSFRAFLLIGGKKSLGVIRGKDMIIVELDGAPPKDILLLMSFLSSGDLMQIVATKPNLRDINILLSKNNQHWVYMRKLKRTSEKIISCYLVLPENGSYAISHDGDKYVSEEQKEIIKKIIGIIENLDKIIEHNVGIIYGDNTLIWIKRHGVILIKSETPLPTEILSLIGAIS